MIHSNTDCLSGSAVYSPTGRVTVAQDIANACLFFAGEEAAQITAQCLPVDGGFSGTRAVQVAWNASMERK